MKKILFLLLTSVVMFSCSSDDNEQENAYINAPSYISFSGNNPEAQTVTISSSHEWIYDIIKNGEEENWFKVKKNGNDLIITSLSNNPSKLENRIGYIHISNEYVNTMLEVVQNVYIYTQEELTDMVNNALIDAEYQVWRGYNSGNSSGWRFGEKDIEINNIRIENGILYYGGGTYSETEIYEAFEIPITLEFRETPLCAIWLYGENDDYIVKKDEERTVFCLYQNAVLLTTEEWWHTSVYDNYIRDKAGSFTITIYKKLHDAPTPSVGYLQFVNIIREMYGGN